MSYFIWFYILMGVWTFGKILNDMLEPDEKPLQGEDRNIFMTVWCALMVICLLIWPVIMFIVWYTGMWKEVYGKKGYRLY